MSSTIAHKKTPIALSLGLAVAGVFSLPYAAAQNAPAAAQNPPAAQSPPPKPVRVRNNLDGFDLTGESANKNQAAATSPNSAPRRVVRPNQVGAVSRGIAGATLYAPSMGKSYSLTPTFFWSTDAPEDEFTFRIVEPGAGPDVLYEAKVTGGRFTYPATAPALQPASTYVWTVQPTGDMLGGPASASVVIVSGKERDAISAALARAQAEHDPAAAAAKVYSDMRVWFDAVASYSSLIERYPNRADFYQARADIYDQLTATAALAEADAARAKK
jgi:hypothetical protein